MTTIDHVIAELESIIQDSIARNNPLGYFAALYQQVTIKVKDGIANHLFEDGKRMEKLDIIFAKRYIDAYNSWKNNQPISKSWEIAFILTEKREPIVLQHLLMGMNAHINLDLGIAAAEVSDESNISDLRNDFNKINEILSAQVNNIQIKLVSIWPFLMKILEKTGLIDDLIVNFSMELARNGAWKFATAITQLSMSEKISQIKIRDNRVAEKSKIITSPGFGVKTVLWIIRLGEKGTVAQKIDTLRYKL